MKKIIGKIWRKTPNFIRLLLIRTSQKKFTVSVGAVIFNEKGEILLLDHVFRPASGWGIPGGFMTHHEQPDETLERELFEEVGLKVKNIRMMWIRTLGRHIEIIFRAEAAGGAKVISREINSLGWFRFEEMPPEMNRGQKEIIKRVLSKTVN